jgi:hypothetical protein
MKKFDYLLNLFVFIILAFRKKYNDPSAVNYNGLAAKELAFYQMILYDYKYQSLMSKLKELHLVRTAELIKSSIRTLTNNMTLYARHQNSVHNLLLKPILQSISTS